MCSTKLKASKAWERLEDSTDVDSSRVPLKQHGHAFSTSFQQKGLEQMTLEEVHRPKDFLVLAVFALILFLPTGIIALHKSWKVKTLCLNPGNYDKAVAASRSARFWGTLSCVIGILILLVAVIVGLVIHYSLQ